jgi:hypothetical protein
VGQYEPTEHEEKLDEHRATAEKGKLCNTIGGVNVVDHHE